MESNFESLAHRAAEFFGSTETSAPDYRWWKDYFSLTGEHMILTENGWEDISAKEEYLKNDPSWEPLDEVGNDKTI